MFVSEDDVRQEKGDGTRLIESLAMYKELWVFLISMVPVIELRGAIPVGLASGIHPVFDFILCVIGNMVPIPFILLFIRPIFHKLKQLPRVHGLVERLEKRAHMKSDTIQKYSFWGLVIFVGIPLPGTGGWTGALIAVLLEMRLRKSLPAILLGVMIAGVIMTIVTELVMAGLTEGMGFLGSFLNWIVG